MKGSNLKPLINRTLGEQPLSFEPPACVEHKGKTGGCSYDESGNAYLRVFAPGAKRVHFKQQRPKREIDFVCTGDGFFEHVIPFCPQMSGPFILELYIDDCFVLYPGFPLGWQGGGLRNVIEIPSVHGALWETRHNPHGALSREIFYSTVLQDFKRFMVYTPPGYMCDEKSYPVLYMLHGGGANELDMFQSGRAAAIFDNLISEGKLEPFIAVATNGMVRFPETSNFVWDDALENMLVKDVIPYVESSYRCRCDKWSRALCGLSMGAYMTNDIGFRHPELFGYMGQFTASMTHLQDFPSYERPFISLMKELEQDPEEFSRRYRVFFRSTTPQEDHFDYFENDDAILAKAGVDKLPCNHRIVYSGQTSKWDSWRLGLHDFVQLIFKS